MVQPCSYSTGKCMLYLSDTSQRDWLYIGCEGLENTSAWFDILSGSGQIKHKSSNWATHTGVVINTSTIHSALPHLHHQMSSRAKVEALLALINKAAQDAIIEYEKDGQSVPFLNSVDTHPLDTAEDSLQLRKTIRLLEGACDQLCATLAPPAHTMINRGQALDWACMHAVIQARVADALANHPNGLHVNELSEVVKIEQGKLARILRLLATKSCFREVNTDVFANNRLSLTLHSSNNIADLVQLHTTLGPKSAVVLYENLTDPDYGPSYDPRKSPFMHAAKDEGISGTFFDWLKSHPEKRETFGRGMIGLGSVMGSLAVLQHFPWNDFSTVCDVGSGIGAFTLPLAKAYPHIKVTLHDLPETIDQAKAVWAKDYPEAVEAQRVDFAPLNFFEGIPAKGKDIYYLRNVIHNWPDASATTIFHNLQQAMLPHSRLLIHDYVLQHLHREKGQIDIANLGVDVAPEPMLPNFGAGNVRSHNQDLTMLLTYNAKERTLGDFLELGAANSLRLERVWDFAETSMLEFRLKSPNDTN